MKEITKREILELEVLADFIGMTIYRGEIPQADYPQQGVGLKRDGEIFLSPISITAMKRKLIRAMQRHNMRTANPSKKATRTLIFPDDDELKWRRVGQVESSLPKYLPHSVIAGRKSAGRKNLVGSLAMILFVTISMLFSYGVRACEDIGTGNERSVITSGQHLQVIYEFADPFGVIENNVEFLFARAAAITDDEISIYHVTVYGPPLFPETNGVARGNMTVLEAREWASSMGLDGIAACSPDLPFYNRIRDKLPAIVHIEGKGTFLVVDRTNRRLRNTIDIWVADPWIGGTYYADDCEGWEVTENGI